MSKEKPTCGDLYLAGLKQYTDMVPELAHTYASGWVGGQCEKVYLGACRAAMFRVSADQRRKVEEVLVDVTRRYDLHWVFTPNSKEYWVYREPQDFMVIVGDMDKCTPDSPGWHRLRAMLCGIPLKEIDEDYHKRPNYNARCD